MAALRWCLLVFLLSSSAQGIAGNPSSSKANKMSARFKDCCSKYITGEGTVSSRSQPAPSPQGLSCLKLIEAPACHTITVTFTEFNLHGPNKPCTSNPCCPDHFLEIRTDDLSQGEIYCGNDIEVGDSFTSTGNELILYYKAKGSSADWSADITFNPIDDCTPDDCQLEVISNSLSHWTSTNFGTSLYPNDDYCFLQRKSNEPSWARITFNTFDIEYHYDIVTITTPRDLVDPEFTGLLTGTVDLPSYNFIATFESDYTVQDYGFNITISRETSNCHELIEPCNVGMSGIITPPQDPNNIWAKKACEWWIRSPAGTKIELEFLDMDLTSDCDDNSVIVNMAGDNHYPVGSSGRHCGDTIPPTGVSEENEVDILFFTNMGGEMFKAKWTVVAA